MAKNKYPGPSRLVVFVGSGASQFAGYRTFETFDSLIFDRNLRASESLPPVRPATIRLMEEIRTSLQYQHKPVTHDNYLWTLNYYLQFCEAFSKTDSIQSRLQDQQSHLWQVIGPFREEIRTAIDDVTVTTLHHYSQDRVKLIKNGDHNAFTKLQKVAAFYAALCNMNYPAQPYLPVFTTNYDLLLEDIFLDSELGYGGMDFTNGIPGVATEQAPWKSDVYDSAGRSGIYLFRLHGCVSWLYHIYGSDDIYHHREDLGYQEPAKLCVMIPGREISRGKKPHALGFREFFNHLLLCQHAVFIGFSFRDDDVMQLLLAANACRTGEALRIVVENPTMNPERVRASLEEASTRSPFPVRLPALDEIDHVNLRFGRDENFDGAIIERVMQEA